jgi:CPA2 family monovalent cation:H+ antiporter-2
MNWALSESTSSSLVLGEIGSVLLMLGVATYFAVKTKFSTVPIFLLGGLFFGNGGILPLSLSDDFLVTGAQIGGILLMLLLGLEYTTSEILDSIKVKKSL